MLQASLLEPVAKLDIKDLIKHSPSPRPQWPVQPGCYARSVSVPSSSSQCKPLPSPSSVSTTSYYSASAAPPQPEQQHCARPPTRSAPFAFLAQAAVSQQDPGNGLAIEAAESHKRTLPADEELEDLPTAKRLSKWGAAENAKIIRLRGKDMKWKDISNELPGRSEIACRLHYQNYLEKRSEWDEERRNKLARVYDRLKADMWNPIANELGVPWRAAEAMHWELGKQEMARRANVTPFSITAAQAEPHQHGNGRVAQRDRMLESTRVFEGRDLSTLSFQSVNGNANGNSHAQYFPSSSPSYILPPPLAAVHLAPIKCENNDDEKDVSDGNQGDDEGSTARKGRSGTGCKLPGLAELDGGVQALAERDRHGMATSDGSEGRRDSGTSDSSWSNCSR